MFLSPWGGSIAIFSARVVDVVYVGRATRRPIRAAGAPEWGVRSMQPDWLGALPGPHVGHIDDLCHIFFCWSPKKLAQTHVVLLSLVALLQIVLVRLELADSLMKLLDLGLQLRSGNS